MVLLLFSLLFFIFHTARFPIEKKARISLVVIKIDSPGVDRNIRISLKTDGFYFFQSHRCLVLTASLFH